MTVGKPPYTIMIVDDTKLIRQTGRDFLTRDGRKNEFIVVETTDGFDALTAVQEARPDLILMDVVMERLDGYTACQAIKSNPDFAHVPIVMLSSKDSPFDKAKGHIMGCDDYLTKPFTSKDLLAMVRKHVGADPS